MAELNCQMHVKTATDYDDIYLTSKSQLVEYDNTISGLSATDTKGAIDELASEKLDKVGDAKDTTVTFTEAVTLANVNSGESNATLWGKVKKMFSNIGRTSIAQANLFDLGANLTVNRCNAWEYKCGNGRYIVVDLALTATASIVTADATLITLKPSYTPIADQGFTVTRNIGTGVQTAYTLIRTSRILQYSTTNTQLLSGQSLYINMRIEL